MLGYAQVLVGTLLLLAETIGFCNANFPTCHSTQECNNVDNDEGFQMAEEILAGPNVNYFKIPPAFPLPGICTADSFPDIDLASIMMVCKVGFELHDICWYQKSSFDMILCEHKIQALLQRCDSNQTSKIENLCKADTAVGAAENQNTPYFTTKHERYYDDTSSIELRLVDAVPAIHISSRCQNCAYFNHSLVLFDSTGTLRHHWFDNSPKSNRAEKHVIGINRWSSFLEASGVISTTHAKIETSVASSSCQYMVNKPVFVFDLLAWQVGHLIIDVLEPLHYAMIKYYGKVIRDSIIFLDIADKKNMKQYMFSALARDVYHRDTLFRLLRLYTRFSIHSKRSLDQMRNQGICFQDIHVQLDVTDTFSIRQQKPPFSPIRQMKYQNFQKYILTSLFGDKPNHLPLQTNAKYNVSIIVRGGSRVLKNVNQLSDVVNEVLPNSRIRELKLENLNFSAQVREFQETNLLICQQGTGFHNVLFMRPKSVVILLMQPGWCDWHWQFSDQAILLDIHVILFCHPSEPRFGDVELKDLGSQLDTDSSAVQKGLNTNNVLRWHRKGWLQGPWYLKSSNTYLDLKTFKKLVLLAKELLLSPSKPVQLLEYPIADSRDEKVAETEFVKEKDANLNVDKIYPFLSYKDIAVDGDVQKLRFIPEILLNGQVGNRSDFDKLSHYELCFRDVTEKVKASANCMTAFSFNEFSTVDIATSNSESASRLVILQMWMQNENGSKRGPSTFVPLPMFPSILEDFTRLLHKRYLTFQIIDLQDNLKRYFHIALGVDPWPTMQLVLSRRCLDLKLDTRDCVRLINYAWKQVERETEAAKANLPAKQGIPTIERPFVFLHLEKTGGTCMGNLLSRPLEKWDGIVPCHGGTDCHTFDLSNKSLNTKTATFIGGHFNWGFWNALNRSDYACFTMTRHPVSRLISYYYERVYEYSGKLLNDLNRSELEFYIQHFKGSSFGRWRDEGMENAGCKMFSGAKIYSGVLPGQEQKMPPWSFDIASPRLSSCVVGIQEHWDESMNMLSTWFPWLADSVDIGCPNTVSGSNRRTLVFENKDTLKKEHVDLLIQNNLCDIKLYEQSLLQFQAQREHISSL